jgi:hypothetical protein
MSDATFRKRVMLAMLAGCRRARFGIHKERLRLLYLTRLEMTQPGERWGLSPPSGPPA